MPFRLTSQKGFAPVEAVLIVVILGIIGGTGYYVYHANQKANRTYNSATMNSSANPKAKSGKNGPQTGPAKTEVFIINEWGVSAAIPTPPEQAALIQYKITNDQQAAAQFTTQELIDAGGSDCSADHEPAGMILRAKPSDTFYLGDGTASDKTVSQELASGDIKTYKKVGDYYYWYIHAQAGCGDAAKTDQLQAAATNEVKQIVVNLRQD